jgi:hypothetical protein
VIVVLWQKEGIAMGVSNCWDSILISNSWEAFFKQKSFHFSSDFEHRGFPT